jgi:NAD(P)-dependent dehydrogenase (short-subunit alcohol dehydrogenase family)
VADGVRDIALVDITHERLLSAVSSLAAIDPSATVLQIGADCSQEAEVEAAVSKTVETFGRLDVCFNAAGMSGDIKPIAEQSSSNLDNVLGLNLKGVWYCQRAQIRQMLKQEMRDVT